MEPPRPPSAPPPGRAPARGDDEHKGAWPAIHARLSSWCGRTSRRSSSPTAGACASGSRAGSTSWRARPWCARITARSPAISDGRSRSCSRPGRCAASWRPARSSSASTWAPSIWWCRSSRRARSRAGCSASAAPVTASAPLARDHAAEVSRRPAGDGGRGPADARRRGRGGPRARSVRSTCLRSRSSRWSPSGPGRSRRSTRVVVRARNFEALSRPLFDGVLDMLSGRYPSAVARPASPICGRASSGIARATRSRRARTRGCSPWSTRGTIPDRGLYAVHLGAEGPRIGELDEEMVHELRVGETFLLGASTWRVVEITRDRVIVKPAPGRAGQDAVLARRGSRAAARARPRARRLRARARRPARPRRGRAGSPPTTSSTRSRRATSSPTSASSRRRPASCRRTTRSSSSASATSSATGASASCRRSAPACTRRGRWRSRRGCRSDRASPCRAVERRRHRAALRRDRHGRDGRPARAHAARARAGGGRGAALARAAALGAVRHPLSARTPARALLLPRNRPGKRTPLWSQRLRAQNLLAVALQDPALSHRARDLSRAAARRLRRAGAGRAPAAGSGGARCASSKSRRRAPRRSRARSCSRTSRPTCTRATRRWPSARRRRSRSIATCCASCSGRRSCAICSSRRRSPMSRPSCRACRPSGARATPTRCTISCAGSAI